MARVHNWQIGRDMSYWYPEAGRRNSSPPSSTSTSASPARPARSPVRRRGRPARARSTCCGTTSSRSRTASIRWRGTCSCWRSSAQSWSGGPYEGQTSLKRRTPANASSAGGPTRSTTRTERRRGRLRGPHREWRRLQVPHLTWFFYLARICNHCTYPACLASCPRGSIYKRPEDGIVLVDQGRCRGYQECVQACPYKKVFLQPDDRHLREVHRLLPEDRERRCSRNAS